MWRTIDAETPDLKYSVKLWVETENQHSNYLEYRIESKNTGAIASGISYPEQFSTHGFLVQLQAQTGTSFGNTTADPAGQVVPSSGPG